jgi:hypothetical protein
VIWLSQVLADVGFRQTKTNAIIFRQSISICLVVNPEYHCHTKNINVQYHMLQDFQAGGGVLMTYRNTNAQIADILTKR